MDFQQTKNILRRLIVNYLKQEKPNLRPIENFIKVNYSTLEKIKKSQFDVIIFTIDNIRKEKKSDIDLLKLLLDKFKDNYTDLNYCIKINSINKNPLFISIVNNKTNIAKFLIENNADINYKINNEIGIIQYTQKYYFKKINGKGLKLINEYINYGFDTLILDYIKYLIDIGNSNLLKLLFDKFLFSHYSELIPQFLYAYTYKKKISTSEIKKIEKKNYFKINLNKKIFDYALKKSNYRIINLLLKYDNQSKKKILENIHQSKLYEKIISDVNFTRTIEKELNLLKFLLYYEIKYKNYEIIEIILNRLKSSLKEWVVTFIIDMMKDDEYIISKINFNEILHLYSEYGKLGYMEKILNITVKYPTKKIDYNYFNKIILRLFSYYDEKKYNKSFKNVLSLIIKNYYYYSNIGEITFLIKECINFKKIKLFEIFITVIKNEINYIFQKIDFEDLLNQFISIEDMNGYKFLKTLGGIIINEEGLLNKIEFNKIILNSMKNKVFGKKFINSLLVQLLNQKNFNTENLKLDEITDCYPLENEPYIKLLKRVLKTKKTNKNFDYKNDQDKTNEINTGNNNKMNIYKGNNNNIMEISNESNNNIIEVYSSIKNCNKITLNDIINSYHNNADKALIECYDSFGNLNDNIYLLNNGDLNGLLIQLIKKCDFAKIEMLLNNKLLFHKSYINYRKSTGEYPLMIAFEEYKLNEKNEDSFKIIKLLLEKGADCNINNKNNKSILDDSLNLNMHPINKLIFDYLIKKNKNYENNSNNSFYTSGKLDTLYNSENKDRNEKNNNGHFNSNIFVKNNNKRILYSDDDYKRILYSDDDYKDKSNNKRILYFDDDYKENKFKKIRSHYKNNITLSYINCEFDYLVYNYLFNKNFDLKKYINSDNINFPDRYCNTILYYCLLKEDLKNIIYLLEEGSNGYINLFTYETIFHGVIYFNLENVIYEILKNRYIIKKLSYLFKDSRYNSGIIDIFQKFIFNDRFSLNIKKIFIKVLLNNFGFDEAIFENIFVIIFEHKYTEISNNIVNILLDYGLKIDKNIEYLNIFDIILKKNLDNIFYRFLKYYDNYEDYRQALNFALLAAIKNQKEQIVEYLFKYNYIKWKFDFFTSNSRSETYYTLTLAIDLNNINILKILINYGGNIESNIIFKKRSLFYYALTREKINEDIIKYLISINANINIFSQDAFAKFIDKLEKNNNLYILKYFINFNHQDFLNNLLKFSVINNKKSIFKILFENTSKKLNIETKIVDNDRYLTIWSYAKKMNRSWTIQYMKKIKTQNIKEKRKIIRKNRRIHKRLLKTAQ